MKNAILVSLLLFQTLAFAQREGGGDFARNYFINTGEEILKQNTFNLKFNTCISHWNLTVADLQKRLTIEVIKNQIGPLYDETGSVVDATSDLNSIQLDANTWPTLILGKANLDQIIVHELIRASGGKDKDDDYLCSKLIAKSSWLPYQPNGEYAAAAKMFTDSKEGQKISDIWEGMSKLTGGNHNDKINCRLETYDNNSSLKIKVTSLLLNTAIAIKHEHRNSFFEYSDPMETIKHNVQISLQNGKNVGLSDQSFYYFLRMSLDQKIIIFEIASPRKVSPNPAISSPNLTNLGFITCT